MTKKFSISVSDFVWTNYLETYKGNNLSGYIESLILKAVIKGEDSKQDLINENQVLKDHVNRLKKELLSLKLIIEKMKDDKEINKIVKAKSQSNKSIIEKYMINDHGIEELKECAKAIKKDSNHLGGQFNRWKNDTGCFDITRDEFVTLIKNINSE